MNSEPLVSVKKEKDLGVIITDNLKVENQCSDAYNKANKMLGFISRNFEFKSKEIVLPLYKSLVRPHLEYCAQFWNPYCRKDIDKIERIQHRATKMIYKLRINLMKYV